MSIHLVIQGPTPTGSDPPVVKKLEEDSTWNPHISDPFAETSVECLLFVSKWKQISRNFDMVLQQHGECMLWMLMLSVALWVILFSWRIYEHLQLTFPILLSLFLYFRNIFSFLKDCVVYCSRMKNTRASMPQRPENNFDATRLEHNLQISEFSSKTVAALFCRFCLKLHNSTFSPPPTFCFDLNFFWVFKFSDGKKPENGCRRKERVDSQTSNLISCHVDHWSALQQC